MSDIMKPQATWADAIRALWPPDSGKRLVIPKQQITHPTAVTGMRPTVGLPAGQLGDYRLPLLPTEASLHVQEFQQHYEAMLAAVDLTAAAVDATAAAIDQIARLPSRVSAGAAVGAILGATLGRSGQSAVAGAVLGGLFGALIEANEPSDDE